MLYTRHKWMKTLCWKLIQIDFERCIYNLWLHQILIANVPFKKLDYYDFISYQRLFSKSKSLGLELSLPSFSEIPFSRICTKYQNIQSSHQWKIFWMFPIIIYTALTILLYLINLLPTLSFNYWFIFTFRSMFKLKKGRI